MAYPPPTDDRAADPLGYLGIVRLPGAARAFLPALLGRLAFAMVGLVILLAVQRATGSFAVAGSATGAFGVANVVASPYRARLVDRIGQRRALVSMAVGFATALGTLAVLTYVDAPAWSLVLGSLVTGFFPPPLGASMRVVWSSLTPPGPTRTRAYSLDAVSEESMFTIGPLLGATLVPALSPSIALAATGCVAVVGTVGMTTSRHSRGHGPRTTGTTPSSRPLRRPGFVGVLTAMAGVGAVLGTVEIAATAFAAKQGAIGSAGTLLAALGAGSVCGGLLYGRQSWAGSLTRRLLLTVLMMAVLTSLLSLVSTTVPLHVGLFLLGFCIAPALVTGYLLSDHLTTADVRTEASSWINTAVNAGAALASAGIGVVVDSRSPGTGFLVGGAAAALLLVLAAVTRPRS
ncbi:MULTISPECIES: MFS transporter [unclassified Rhodococcus (in: high G+C Gram-positive bacteria)]|uniref:MFS transporter n=1 Tax=unclassified Rhodococcus (in: high G+C Gram-positive bacteria) TaxID=192944 RepID=UPI0009E6DE68|nr:MULTISPECIES: MFS transporter [unclassified Rhodococcus (in: high G+C Gram-positive bacteria)]